MHTTVNQRSKLVRVAIWLLIICAVLAAGGLFFEWQLVSRAMPDRVGDWQLFRLIGLFLTNLVFTAVLAAIALLYFWVRFAKSLPDLQGWHIQRPDSEFCAADATSQYTLENYLEQEAKVFKELDVLIAGPWKNQQSGAYNRYEADSVSNPETITDRNWNRSYVLQANNPIGGVLLVHGLSDSPYSLRALGMRLHTEGYTVVWLRVPGHGTCPSALANVSWQDWAAAVKIAMCGLRDLLPHGSPLFLGGYSSGGALSVHYALSSIEDASLPKVTGIALFSPMIGINPLARITRLYHTVALVSRNRKAQWSNISAEVDPYKYNSWPMNASVQAWSVTQVVERKLTALTKTGKMIEMPPILAMQSVVDSTVAVPKLITVLFDRWPSELSELFLFDINRADWIGNLFNLSFEKEIIPKLKRTDLSYRLSILSNKETGSQQVQLQTRDGESWVEQATKMSWPNGVVSLSHIAVPIPPEDSIYGTSEATAESGLSLGSVSLRAEPNSLMVPSSLFVRCRHNPFYKFMEDRVLSWYAQATDKSSGENN